MVKRALEKGDVVMLSFDSQAGDEQKGRRPTLIVSNKMFNKYVGMAFACPITRTKRGFPFHVAFAGKKISGYIMTEQLWSIDYHARRLQFVEKADVKTLEHVLGLIDAILE